MLFLSTYSPGSPLGYQTHITGQKEPALLTHPSSTHQVTTQILFGDNEFNRLPPQPSLSTWYLPEALTQLQVPRDRRQQKGTSPSLLSVQSLQRSSSKMQVVTLEVSALTPFCHLVASLCESG